MSLFLSMRRWRRIVLVSVVALVGLAIALWFRRDAHLIATFSMEDEVHAVAISADGRYLAAGDRQGRVVLWNHVAETPHWSMSGHQGAVTTLAFSPDGQILVSGAQDGVMRLWDVATGQEKNFQTQITPNQSLKSLTDDSGISPFQAGISQIVFSPNGQVLAVAGASGRIVILQANTGAVIFNLRGHPVKTTPGRYRDILRVAFSPDGHSLTSVANDDTISLWDMHTGQLIASFATQYIHLMEALAFSPDGQNLIVVPFHGDIQIWSLPRQQRFWSGSLPAWDVPSAAVTADSRIIARGGSTYAGTFTKGLPIIGQSDATIYLAHLMNPVPANQDGRCAIPSAPGVTSVKSTPCPRVEPFLALRGHRDTVSALAFSHDGKWLVSGSWDKTVRLWAVNEDDSMTPPAT
jgi:WD40 repeat protein